MASTRARSGLAVVAIGVALFATLGEASTTNTSSGNQAPSASASSGTSKTTSSAASKEDSTTTTTLAAPAAPAAPGASPFVKTFGDFSVVPLPAGDPDVVSVIASTKSVDSSGSVTIVVRNNTGKTVGSINVTGTARDAAGKLVGSGSQGEMNPSIVAPGEIAYGYVYFKTDSPAGSALTFAYDIKFKSPPGTYNVPLTITEMNNTGSKIVGSVTNGSGGKVTGPISVDGICFAYDGSILDNISGYTEQPELADEGTGTFSIDLYSDACPIGIVASSGYGKL